MRLGGVSLSDWRLRRGLMLAPLQLTGRWVDIRLVGYERGLALRAAPSRGVGPMPAQYHLGYLLGRLTQLLGVLGLLSRSGIRYRVLDEYRLSLFSLALAWAGPGLRGGPGVYIWVGRRPPQRHRAPAPSLWLALNPLTNMVPYSGVSGSLVLWALLGVWL